MIPYDLFVHQTFIFINVSYGSFSKEITIIWSDLVTATKRLTPGASSVPHNSLFSLYFFEINIYFIKALYQFIVLSFPSYHPFSKNSSTFKAVVSCISLYISREYTCILVSCLSIVDTAYLFHILQLKSHIICTTTTTIPLFLFPHLSDILTSEFLAKSVIFVHTLYLFYTVYIVFVEKFFFFFP